MSTHGKSSIACIQLALGKLAEAKFWLSEASEAYEDKIVQIDDAISAVNTAMNDSRYAAHKITEAMKCD